jgi:hypothetical protein
LFVCLSVFVKVSLNVFLVLEDDKMSSSRVCNLMFIFLHLGPSVFLHILDT